MVADIRIQLMMLVDEYRVARARVDAVHASAMNMWVAARSPDQSVTVTVDAFGGLRELHIDAKYAGKLDPRKLAEAIVTVSRFAAVQARERLRAALRRALPDRLRDLVGSDGTVDLAPMFHTEIEYLVRQVHEPCDEPVSGIAFEHPQTDQ